MSLINAKPRFGLEGDKLYDYKQGKYLVVTGGMYIGDVNGFWDANKVVELIKKGESIEAAWEPVIDKPNSPPPLLSETEQANQDFLKTLHEHLDKALASGPSTPVKPVK